MSVGASSQSVARQFVSRLRVGLVVIWTIFWTTLALMIHLVTRSHDLPLALARRPWAPGALRLMGARLAVQGAGELDLSQSYLFVANHTSQLDIPVLFGALPVALRFLAKEELRRIPLVSQFITAMGMVFVDRSDSEAARRSIERLAESLAGGMSLMAFPEGTRSRDGGMGEFKTGAFVAAIKSGVPVVPLHIDGAAAILPAGTVEVNPGRVVVTVGEPVPSQHLTLEDRRQLADLVRSRMMELSTAQRASASGGSG